MDIRRINSTDLERIIEYQKSVFPERREKAAGLIGFWLSKSAQEAESSFVLVDGEEIKGMLMFSSMDYFFEGNTNADFWAFDLIVDENLRKEGWGLNLMMRAFKQHNTCFCAGSGPFALKIELKLGFHIIGEIRKYVRLVNPLCLFTAFMRGNIRRESFPNSVVIGSEQFMRVPLEQMSESHQPFNPQLLEISRTKDFLLWRYGQLHDYVIFKSHESDDYFVLRTIVKHGVTALVMVDFRCDVKKEGCYGRIVDATIKIAKELRLPVVIVGSSLTTIDSELERRAFKSVGRPRPIISKDKRFKSYKQAIDERDFCLVTLADSDGEVLW